jgi:hypothetical protein
MKLLYAHFGLVRDLGDVITQIGAEGFEFEFLTAANAARGVDVLTHPHGAWPRRARGSMP